MNHHLDGDGFHLTDKQPTWRHHCLSHALSTANFGTASGRAEVWGGPLARGAFVVALLNRGADDGVNITAEWAMLEVPAETKDPVKATEAVPQQPALRTARARSGSSWRAPSSAMR